MSQSPREIIWFAPEAGLWQSAELENDLANSWCESGNEITIIRCKGVLKAYCAVMTAEGIPPDASDKLKEKACKECRFNASTLDTPQTAKYKTLWLDDFVTQEVLYRATQLCQSVSKDNWEGFYLSDVPVGRFASYSTLLHHKIPSPNTNDNAWNEYMADLYNSLIVSLALPRIFEFVNPDLAVVYNPLYPTHRIFTEQANSRRIPILGVTAGGYTPDRYSSIALYPKIHSSQTARDSVSIARGLNEPLSEIEIAAVSRHVSHQILGRDPWVYSSPPTAMSTSEIRTRLGLRPNSQVVVVLIGSPDETRASDMVGAEFERSTSRLSDVTEFVKQSLDAARSMPNVDFIFRLHPRMLANKREKLDSPDLNEIYQILDKAPPNAHINQSGDGIGLYDTARIASVGLNHASTSGLEFLLLGIPVVHYDPPRLNAYPPEFGFEVQRLDVSELKETINEALSVGWSDSYSIQAYRWLATTLIRSLIHRNSLTFDQSKTESIHEMHLTHQDYFRFRRMIPESIRERISRYQARRNRSREFKIQRESDSRGHNWRVEAGDRLVKMDDGDVWEPLIVQRGEPLTQDEEQGRIESEVHNFIEQLGGLESYSLRN